MGRCTSGKPPPVADAVYVFLSQALYTGRLPFEPFPENTQYLKDKAMDRFLADVEKGWNSAESGGLWTLDEAETRLGNTQTKTKETSRDYLYPVAKDN